MIGVYDMSLKTYEAVNHSFANQQDSDVKLLSGWLHSAAHSLAPN